MKTDMKQKYTMKFLIVALFVLGAVSFGHALQGEDSPYVGSEECGKCHLKEYKSWEQTNLARALLVLGPRKMMKIKKNAGLDPYADYTREPKCLKCHTTGFEQKKDGSYVFAEYGIGCEACHGAGKKYSMIMKLKGRDYKREELIEAGLYADFSGICEKCHNEEAPVVEADYKFSHKERYEKVHIPAKLKYHQQIERFKNEDEKE